MGGQKRQEALTPTIAVDFDGTLCKEEWPGIGAPNEKLIDFLIRWRQDGNKVILWTCRENTMLVQAVDWCAEHGLHFDAVNCNLPERVIAYNNDSRKIGADYYIDNACTLVVDNKQVITPPRKEIWL